MLDLAQVCWIPNSQSATYQVMVLLPLNSHDKEWNFIITLFKSYIYNNLWPKTWVSCSKHRTATPENLDKET